MGEALDKQFAEVVREMTKTATTATPRSPRRATARSSSSSPASSRCATSSRPGRAPAALVQQQPLAPPAGRQLSRAGAQRKPVGAAAVSRGTSSTLALATGQQTARARRDARPRESAPAGGICQGDLFQRLRLHQECRSDPQRAARTRRPQRGGGGGRADPQADITSVRSAASAGEIVIRLNGACDSTASRRWNTGREAARVARRSPR